MIYDLLTPSPKTPILKHWAQVPFLASKGQIDFKPGLNIVFGPNGSGKSTLITTLARLLHCEQSGMQSMTETSLRLLLEGVGFDDDDKFMKNMQRVTNDGQDCRYVGAEQDVGYGLTSIDEDFGLDQILTMFARKGSSSGQLSFHKLNRVMMSEPRKPGPVPVHFKLGEDRVNPLWQARVKGALAVVKPSPRKDVNPQFTLLADEPERSMDFQKQAEVWAFLRSAVSSGKVQIIVATHSVMALGIPEATYIETTDGAVERATKALAKTGWHRDPVGAPMPYVEAEEPVAKKTAGPKAKRTRRAARG